jgi:hypothetical protein
VLDCITVEQHLGLEGHLDSTHASTRTQAHHRSPKSTHNTRVRHTLHIESPGILNKCYPALACTLSARVSTLYTHPTSAAMQRLVADQRALLDARASDAGTLKADLAAVMQCVWRFLLCRVLLIGQPAKLLHGRGSPAQ